MMDKNLADSAVMKRVKTSALIIAVCTLTLFSVGGTTSCSNSKTTDNTSHAENDDAEPIAVVENKASDSATGANNNNAAGNDSLGTSTQNTEILMGRRVVYDVNNWDKGNHERYGINDLSDLQKVLGKVTSTDENSLDFANNSAIKYRFMQGDAPYLDIIDSQKYFELGWYYANPDDSKEQKEMSIDHAKKAYQLANNLMGEAGGELVRRMLTNQIIKNEVIDGSYVELAKCEFYSCMLIIRKQEN